jgi:hypothetical protein
MLETMLTDCPLTFLSHHNRGALSSVHTSQSLLAPPASVSRLQLQTLAAQTADRQFHLRFPKFLITRRRRPL